MNREYVEVQLRQARHDFLVENWPPHLQRASKIERQVLALVGHPRYELDKADNGSLIFRSDLMDVPNAAIMFVEQNKEALIAWVEHTNQINARIARLTAQLREMETTG